MGQLGRERRGKERVWCYDPAAFGRLVREGIKARGLASIRAAARKANIPFETLRRIVAGKGSAVTIVTLRRLAAAKLIPDPAHESLISPELRRRYVQSLNRELVYLSRDDPDAVGIIEKYIRNNLDAVQLAQWGTPPHGVRWRYTPQLSALRRAWIVAPILATWPNAAPYRPLRDFSRQEIRKIVQAMTKVTAIIFARESDTEQMSRYGVVKPPSLASLLGYGPR